MTAPTTSASTSDSNAVSVGCDAWLSHTCPADAYRLAQDGRCACGQASLAAALGRNAGDILHAFPGPGLWVNDARMKQALKTLGITHYEVGSKKLDQMAVLWIQGLGSWMRPGVPMGARNQRTHWVASHEGLIYDLNADSWLPSAVWREQILPDLLHAWKAKDFEVRKTFLVWDNDEMRDAKGVTKL